ncbi:hypothetical protein SAMN04488589_1846 [Methanolobus vulcani]|uniref:Uncharacterized protein n=1 Tax=Methanolobus vulcani TaxID=38026 RepID=A0A7Z7FCX6_9EURY|nr:hypothetical protein [Methanolobus vulcani]SDF96573.1 hypothetical protein SAMN04488589_1846 [Methanolobus vulcani]
MTQQSGDEQNDTRAYIMDHLGIPEDARVVASEPYLSGLPFSPDLTLEKGDMLYVIEIKSRVTVDAISRLNLFRELWQREKGSGKQVVPVLAAKYIPKMEEELMDKLGIEAIKLPRSLVSENREQYTSASHRITSEKSWKVVSRLLKEKKTSIRQLSLMENVSYGWAHKTIKGLMQQNIIRQDNGHVSISDVNKLLSGIAWGRPFSNLMIEEIRIDFENSTTAAKEITSALKAQNDIPFGFTSYTAASLYTGYGVRHDAVYLYMQEENLSYFRELFASNSDKGTLAYIYRTDRNVFHDVREKEDIRIVSPSQTLLDLAGMGYSAMDITKQLVSVYATI